MQHRKALLVSLLQTMLLTVSLSAAPLLAAAAATPSAPLKITIYGGTGHIGQRIVNEALSRGHSVTVVVRDPASSSAPRPHLSMVKGDALDSAAVARQIAGQDVVISAIGGGSSQGADFYTRVGQSYVSALRSLGRSAPRLIAIGGASSLEIAPGKTLLDTMPNAPPNSDMVTHKHALDYYRSIDDVQWTFVSPSMQIEPGTRSGKFRLGTDQVLKDANGQSRISMEDFAVAVIDEAEHPQHLHQRFTVGY